MITRFRALMALAFLGLFAALAYAPSAPAATTRPVPNVCHKVAKADYGLCQQVRRQLMYAYVTKGGNLNQVADGQSLVREEVVGAGLTKAEMHTALLGYAKDYDKHVNRAKAVAVDLDSLRGAYGTDTRYGVGFYDIDGKPGGKKVFDVTLDLP